MGGGGTPKGVPCSPARVCLCVYDDEGKIKRPSRINNYLLRSRAADQHEMDPAFETAKEVPNPSGSSPGHGGQEGSGSPGKSLTEIFSLALSQI